MTSLGLTVDQSNKRIGRSLLGGAALLSLWSIPVFKAWLSQRFRFFEAYDMTGLVVILLAVGIAANYRSHRRLAAPHVLSFLRFHFSYLICMAVSLSWTTAPLYGQMKTLKFAGVSTLSYVAPLLILRDEYDLKVFSRLLIAFGAIVATTTLLFPSYERVDSIRVSAFNANALNPAYLMAVAASLCLVPGDLVRSTPIRLGIAAFLEIGIVTTGSRSMAVQPFLALLIWSLVGFGNRRFFVRATVLLALGLMTSFVVVQFASLIPSQDTSQRGRVIRLISDPFASFQQSGRGRLWGFVLQHSSDAIVMGHGAGSFAVDCHGTDERRFPHNLFLEALYEQGILGLFALLALMIVAVTSMLRSQSVLFNARSVAAWVPASMAALISISVHWDVPDNRVLWFMFGIGAWIAGYFRLRNSERITQ